MHRRGLSAAARPETTATAEAAAAANIRCGMEPEEIRAQMEEIEGRVAESLRLAEAQRALVAALERGGDDAAEARRVLRIIEERLARDEEARDRMRRDLAVLRRKEG